MRALSPSPQIYGWGTESLPVTGCAMHHFPGAPPAARASPPTPTPSQLGCCQRSGQLGWETPSLGATSRGSKSSAACSLGLSVCPRCTQHGQAGCEPVADAGQSPRLRGPRGRESPSGQAALGFLTHPVGQKLTQSLGERGEEAALSKAASELAALTHPTRLRATPATPHLGVHKGSRFVPVGLAAPQQCVWAEQFAWTHLSVP